MNISIFFVGGTTLEIENAGLIKVDPSIRVLLIQDAVGDQFAFVLDNVRYWKTENLKVRQ